MGKIVLYSVLQMMMQGSVVGNFLSPLSYLFIYLLWVGLLFFPCSLPVYYYFVTSNSSFQVPFPYNIFINDPITKKTDIY